MIKVFLLVSVLAMGCELPAQKSGSRSSHSFSDHFDAGLEVSNGWFAIEYGRKENLKLVTDTARAGAKALKITLRKNDPESQYGNKRTELTYNYYPDSKLIDTTLRWYGFSNYFPSTYGADPAEEIIAQWHISSPKCGASPTLAIEIKDDHFRAVVRFSTADYCDSPKSIVQKIFDLGPVKKDSWMDWKIQYNPNTNASGRIQIWRNDSSVLKYSGPCQYIGSPFPYFKIGLYKWCWMPGWTGTQSKQEERTYFLDEVMIGANKSDIRRPAGKGRPAL
ncbi:polysaccharide lyase [Flavihumibacter profundi]|uniref:polysaccharide lyase n=1 Tax=Flavihumibacter profundi TaxID=2716883 RepID=UPI001CC5A1B8|nr:polysaccharide lyase [Flavihumibacter profundi]MBZ5857428.1 polysaccharide lyase [Flavihumibacter profundi]